MLINHKSNSLLNDMEHEHQIFVIKAFCSRVEHHILLLGWNKWYTYITNLQKKEINIKKAIHKFNNHLLYQSVRQIKIITVF